MLRILFIFVLLLAGCQKNEEQNGISNLQRPNMVAGYGERTFAERYAVNMKLPISESSFLALLKRLNLDYDSCGFPTPVPLHSSKFKISRGMTCYHILGDSDLTKRSREEWRAYGNGRGQIVYIESAYSYTST